ncbi:hypothetical protein V2J09_008292, partial [Rumex salicifolius]
TFQIGSDKHRDSHSYNFVVVFFLLSFCESVFSPSTKIYRFLRLHTKSAFDRALNSMASSNINYEEGFITNKRGLKLFTCKWIPQETEPKALVFLLHGYATECSISMKGTATRLSRAGYRVYGLDCIGHGKSEGLHGFIPSFDELLEDYSLHYTDICEEEENAKKKRFIMGESMGGAVALRLHRKMPGFWDGVVLVAPMCKIKENVKPSPLVLSILTKLCNVIPTWKIVPGDDIMKAALRDPEAIKQVTDLNISKLLYETAASTDKTFKLYDGMWHNLTFGEFPENIDRVLADIIAWLDERSAMDEKEKKFMEDKNVSISAPTYSFN